MTHAQVKTSFFQDIELFGGIGTSHYFGDIGGRDTAWHSTQQVAGIIDNLDIDWDQTRVAFTGGARFTRWKNFALTTQLSPVFLSGSDQHSNYENRNLKFSSTLLELSVLGEYYFANRLTGFAPYGFLGIGGWLLMGSGNFTVEEVNDAYIVNPVNPYERFPDKGLTDGLSFLMGLGMRLPATGRYTHSIDLTYHFTSSDELDGLPTKRNTNDLFVCFSYKINMEYYSLWTYDHRGRIK
jgi:hypothetical protein